MTFLAFTEASPLPDWKSQKWLNLLSKPSMAPGGWSSAGLGAAPSLSSDIYYCLGKGRDSICLGMKGTGKGFWELSGRRDKPDV